MRQKKLRLPSVKWVAPFRADIHCRKHNVRYFTFGACPDCQRESLDLIFYGNKNEKVTKTSSTRPIKKAR